ncbi:MAG: hypothetical protein ACRD3J_01780, partial [Thermoanaerobaculia bacterium]
MRRQFAIVILAVLLALPAVAARRRPVAPVASDALAIVFVDVPATEGTFTAAGGEAWLDVNDVAHRASRHERGTRVQRRFGIRVVRATGTASGTATITARLESSDGRTSMRLDGKPLTEAAAIVDAHAAIGAVVYH